MKTMVMKKKSRVSVHKPMAEVSDELMFDILSMFHEGKKRRHSLERRRDQNLSGAQSNSLAVLPNDLFYDIVSRLPGKQVMQCKSVCKIWMSMIRSPLFMELARNRHLPSLILHQEEDIDDPASINYLSSTLLRFTEPSAKEGESRYLVQLKTDPDLANRIDEILTEVVNGLVCYYNSSNSFLTLFNVCTGQAMRIHAPSCYTSYPALSTQRFHLGYDPATRTYKLLRYGIQREGWRCWMRAEIMTLISPSSGSVSTWREVDNACCGYISSKSVSTDDGFLWFSSESIDALISFDLNKEKFKVIELEEHVVDMIRSNAFRFIQLMGCPAIRIVHPRGYEYFTLYIFDKDESVWRTHFVQWPKEYGIMDTIVDLGNLPTGEILWMNREKKNQGLHGYFYSYNHHISKFNRFRVGEVQDSVLDIVHGFTSINAKISCLDDNGSLYLPLDNVLSNGNCVMI